MSFLELGGTLPVAERLSTPPVVQPSDPFAISEHESHDALQTLEEISNQMFNLTRPLPASKSIRSLGPEIQDREDGLLTLASSDRRVTRSMSTPKRTQRALLKERIMQTDGNDIICNTLRISNDEVTTGSVRDGIHIIGDKSTTGEDAQSSSSLSSLSQEARLLSQIALHFS